MDSQGAPLVCYAKKWNPLFSENREFNDDWSRSYLELKRKINAAGDWIDLFFQEYEGTIASCKLEELKEFCRRVSVDNPNSAAGTPGRAWLDERSRPGPDSDSLARDHKNPLDSTQLHEGLKPPRIGCEAKSNVDRRLVYIEKIEPSDILALAKTALSHEVPVLRDALWKHFARQTSLRVKIPSKGFAIFQLEFHLKFFAFRTSPPANEPLPGKSAGNDSSSQWTDLSFLEIPTPKSLDQRKYGMLEAHFSFVICGSDETRWVGWAFDNTVFDGEDLLDRISPCPGFHADPIASDGETDAELPIWNPREYFLMIIESRIAQAQEEWEGLVIPIERSIRAYREKHPSTLSQPSGTIRDNVKKTFDWTRQTAELLSRLKEALSGTITFWERFNSLHGDVGYFANIQSSEASRQHVQSSLRAINDAFEALQDLQRTLNLMSDFCQDYANALQLRLTLEGSEATKSSGATTDFTLFVLGPPALAAACLQLSPAVMPLPPNPTSLFMLTAVFMVAMRLLYAIFGALSGLNWKWKTLMTLTKTMKLEGAGSCLSPRAWRRLVPGRARSQNDRNTPQDVEMGTVHF